LTSARLAGNSSDMKRSVVLVQLLVTAVCAAVGGFVAVSVSGDAVDADRGGMTAAVPMMTEAQLRVGGASASSDLATTTITPVRILDTREGAAALAGSKTPWGALETRTVEAAGLGTIPADVVGVVVNVTVLNATAPDTFLTLFPTGTAMPNASTINPQPNEVAFNAATVLLGGDDGTFEIYNYSGSVDVIVDVTAYMTRTLADAVDTVEGEVDDVAVDVGQLKSFTAVMTDGEGNQYPTFRVNENAAIQVNGDWLWFNKLGFSPNVTTYFESSNCTGATYVFSGYKNTYLEALEVIPVMQTNMGYSQVGGDPVLISFGETSSNLKLDAMGSAIDPQSGNCVTDFVRGDSFVAVAITSPIVNAPVPPFEVSVVSQ